MRLVYPKPEIAGLRRIRNVFIRKIRDELSVHRNEMLEPKRTRHDVVGATRLGGEGWRDGGRTVNRQLFDAGHVRKPAAQASQIARAPRLCVKTHVPEPHEIVVGRRQDTRIELQHNIPFHGRLEEYLPMMGLVRTAAGNAVWLDANKTSPYDFYQYWRNVGDADVLKCIRMLTFLPLSQIEEMAKWEGSQLNQAKEILAYELTKMVHGTEEADKAQNAARAVFSAGAAADMPSTEIPADALTDGEIGILTLMVQCGLAKSNGEARRLVQQGGVFLGEEKVTDPARAVTAEELKAGAVIRKGKKVFHKAVLA